MTVRRLFTLLSWIAAAAATDTMRAVRTNGGCTTPFSCVRIARVDKPTPSDGQALIRVNASSVNPSDVDTVIGGGCALGCGADVAGTVVACPGCKTLRVGDEVWGMVSDAFSDYAITFETMIAPKPNSLDMQSAATIPEVGLTSWLSLKRTEPGMAIPPGSPWINHSNFPNLTVLVTSGAGGTGFLAIQLAKAWGAKHIATSTTSKEGFNFVKSLGATYVVDYKKEDILDSLPDNSVDIVYDNYGKEGTADKAMRVIRPEGVYLLLPHGECYMKKIQGPPCLAAEPKAGVRQLNYDTGPDFQAHSREGLNELKELFEVGRLVPRVDRTFLLEDAAEAFSYSKGAGAGGVGHHYGKISISMMAVEQLENFTFVI